ncbi:hypothetical protein TWF281_006961 [Arthrobotrys megalospora]
MTIIREPPQIIQQPTPPTPGPGPITTEPPKPIPEVMIVPGKPDPAIERENEDLRKRIGEIEQENITLRGEAEGQKSQIEVLRLNCRWFADMLASFTRGNENARTLLGPYPYIDAFKARPNEKHRQTVHRRFPIGKGEMDDHWPVNGS